MRIRPFQEHAYAFFVTLVVINGQACSGLQGVFPSRVNARLVSYQGDLYMYGGYPASFLIHGFNHIPCYSGKEQFMVKLNQTTHTWESVSLTGMPEKRRLDKHAFSRGQASSASCTLLLNFT